MNTCKATRLMSLIAENSAKKLNVGAVAPYLKKPTVLPENQMESYVLISGTDYPDFRVEFFKNYEQLVQLNAEMQIQGFYLKSCDFNPIKGRSDGIALWHFESDSTIETFNDVTSFKSIVATKNSFIVESDNLPAFEKQFEKLKQSSTLMGISVSPSQLSLFNGQEMGLKVQSLWQKEQPRKFYFYYGLRTSQLR